MIMKLNELMDMDSMKSQIDPKEMRRRVIQGGNDPFGKIAKTPKKDVKKASAKDAKLPAGLQAAK
jgi:hypothetical protein